MGQLHDHSHQRIGLCVLASLSVYAQQNNDSVRVLREVIIEQSRLGNYAISKFTLHVDSMTRALASAGSLADMLRKYGYGHVRGYGYEIPRAGYSIGDCSDQ